MELVNTISMKKTRLENFSILSGKSSKCREKMLCFLNKVMKRCKTFLNHKSLFLVLNSKAYRRLIG